MSSSTVGLEGQVSSGGGIRTVDAGVADALLEVDYRAEDPLGELTALERRQAEILTAVARTMYPHDQLPDLHYQRVAAALDVKAAADDQMRSVLTEGLGFLATVTGRKPEDFGSLPEAEQVTALKRMEELPFFTTIAAEVVVNLYSQPDVWPYFGYEGPSTDKGGYLERGFDDIDWLDSAPDRRSAPVVEQTTTENDAEITTTEPGPGR